MIASTLIGGLVLIAGIVVLARTAIGSGRMSDPRPGPAGPTLEPRQRGVEFFGLKANWPGLAMVAAGAVLLLLPLLT